MLLPRIIPQTLLFFLLLFILIALSSLSSSPKKEWKKTRDCIMEEYVHSDMAQEECAQIWEHYDAIEINGDWVVFEEIYNKRKDRTMEWERFHFIFGIYRQPGLVSYRREFAYSCLTTFLINNKNGLIGAAKAAATMNPKELEYFLWVYRIVDSRNGDVYEIKDLLEGKYGTREFSDAILKKAVEEDFHRIRECFQWTGETEEFIQNIRRLKEKHDVEKEREKAENEKAKKIKKDEKGEL